MASIESKPWGIEDEGLVFTRLRAGWSADGSVAYLDGKRRSAGDGLGEGGRAERAERRGTRARAEHRLGDAGGPVRGLDPVGGGGDADVGLPSDPEGSIGKRIVIVLVPRMPETYELIAE